MITIQTITHIIDVNDIHDQTGGLLKLTISLTLFLDHYGPETEFKPVCFTIFSFNFTISYEVSL